MTATQLDFSHSFAHLGVHLREAVKALHEGKAILLLDANDRENEGDLVVAAEKITPQTMNFLIKQGSGVVCLAMPRAKLSALNLPLMIHDNTNMFETAFTVSIEAVRGVSTGVSAQDRAHTIQTAIADDAKPEHLARPGHVFPLAAKMGGVFERMGHTEGSVDLMKMAGLKPGAVLCELMNQDGSMTIGQDRITFAKENKIPMLSVEDILFHRIKNDDILGKVSHKTIDSKHGSLSWHQFQALGSTIDIFMRHDFDKNVAAPLSIVDGKNLHNRFLASVLAPSNDDALLLAMESLTNPSAVVAMLSNGGSERQNLALLCRVLSEIGVTSLLNNPLHGQFFTIAKEHFSFKINN